MVTSKAHSRHPTWPPTTQLLPSIITSREKTPRSLIKAETRYTSTLPEISEDEDPFSHFLSPVLDEETPFEGTNYTAGILPYESSSSSTLSGRDALFRARLEEKWETFVARRLLQHSRSNTAAIPAPLPPPFPQEPTTPPAEDVPELFEETMDMEIPNTPDDSPASPSQMGWYFPSTVDGSGSDYDDMSDDDFDFSDSDSESDSDSLDGWEADRRLAATRGRSTQQISHTRNRTTFRYSPRLSSGKKHAWREPGPDLWTVNEEDEIAIENEERSRPRKRTKTVHWNEQVQVLEYER